MKNNTGFRGGYYHNLQIGSCCYECKNRHPACHDTCETYKTKKAEWQERQKKIKEYRDNQRIYDDFHYGQVVKSRRAKEQKNAKKYGEV